MILVILLVFGKVVRWAAFLALFFEFTCMFMTTCSMSYTHRLPVLGVDRIYIDVTYHCYMFSRAEKE
jgi:hypothetical protein